jgi:hypothetical protein
MTVSVPDDMPECGKAAAGGQFQSFRVTMPKQNSKDADGLDVQQETYDPNGGSHHSFPDIDAFKAWLAHEEEEKVVEFVQSDRHGSKANPPRFKEHVKLVCARHGRNGTKVCILVYYDILAHNLKKRYEKKYPDRKRKWSTLKVSKL